MHYYDPALILTAIFVLWMSRGINSTTRRLKDLLNISRGAAELAHMTVGMSPLSVSNCTRLPASASLVTSIIANPAELGGLSFCKLDIGRGGSNLERLEMVVSRACCHSGEYMASDQALRGLDLVYMLILVSKTVFISVCTPLVAISFSASEQLVCSNPVRLCQDFSSGDSRRENCLIICLWVASRDL